jgi:methanogenic corrinoid protein MtbC1
MIALAPRIEPNGRTILITSVAGDAHDIGVSIVSAFFEMDGWRSICLGANTPIEDVVHMTERVDADVVALGATLDTQRAGAAGTIAALRAVRPNQRVIVGGSAFGDQARTWQRIGADAFAGSPREALESAKRLVSS